MDKKPKEFRKLIGSCFTRPAGGLWGCKGNEWYDYITTDGLKDEPNYPLERLNTCFEWELDKKAKIFTIDTAEDFVFLVENYFRKIRNKNIAEINYKKLAKDYDAVVATKNAIDTLKNGCRLYGGYTYQWQLKAFLYKIGLLKWDVPSICVFDPEKFVKNVKILKEK